MNTFEKNNQIRKEIEKAITWRHEGKMSGIISLSTSPLKNSHCQNRCKVSGLICEDCFSINMNEFREALREKLIRNTELLTKEVYPVSAMPILNVAYFRLESFGDLNNTIQVMNYFNLCKANKHVTFALWTKNPFIIKQALAEGAKKPGNLIVIYSSPAKNTKVNFEALKKFFPFVDKLFTVYDKEHANGVEINCGSNHCLTCLKCYKKRTTNMINEKLK